MWRLDDKEKSQSQRYCINVFYFNNFLLFRIFETGSYKGYFRSYGKEILLKNISIPPGKTLTDVLLVDIYTEWDVAVAREHRLKLKDKGIF